MSAPSQIAATLYREAPLRAADAPAVEAFASLEAAARRINDQRGAFGLDIRPARARYDDGAEFEAYSLSVTRPDGRRRWLCLALLHGAGQSALEAALRQTANETAGMRKAAA